MMGQHSGNTFVAMAAIAREEGIQSLYRGLALTWIKQVPQNALTFLAYDMAKDWLNVG
jgi:hypothetical protein